MLNDSLKKIDKLVQSCKAELEEVHLLDVVLYSTFAKNIATALLIEM